MPFSDLALLPSKTLRSQLNYLQHRLRPPETSADNGTVVFIFQQLNRATPSIAGDTFGNNPPSADNVTPVADETHSAIPDLVAYTDQQPPTATNYCLPTHHYVS